MTEINPDPRGVNAVKLANAISHALSSKLHISVDDNQTEINGNSIKLVTKSRRNGRVRDHEKILAKINPDTQTVSFEITSFRLYETGRGPIHVQPPKGTAEGFLKQLKSALNQQAHLMREYL